MAYSVKAIEHYPLYAYKGTNRHHHSIFQLKMLHQPLALETVHKRYFYLFLLSVFIHTTASLMMGKQVILTDLI
ncbi:hypothetical protein AT238_07005 [Bartonella henselae]|nr:hypothetical protein AT244_03085 [Bartonella henselae]OLL42895.1 hypothetical protein AT245_03170 [Bartonella henselae]OLL53479.1 hypothetical protein AT238_07005 [Bartonella henselae]